MVAPPRWSCIIAKFSFAVQSAAATEWRHTPCCLKPLKLLGIYAQPSLHSAGKIFAQLPFKAAERRRACKACFFAADRAICAQSLVSLYVEGYQRFVAAGVHVGKAKAEKTLGFLYSVLDVYFEKLTYFFALFVLWRALYICSLACGLSFTIFSMEETISTATNTAIIISSSVELATA